MSYKEIKEILAYKLKPKSETPHGFIAPLAEIIGHNVAQKFVKLDNNNFPNFENNVIIYNHYENIENNFSDDEIFKIKVYPLEKERLKDIDRAASYAGNFNGDYNKYINKLQPRELIEVIAHELPDCNERSLYVTYYPTTTYVTILDKDTYYGIFNWKKDVQENYIKITPVDKFLGGSFLPGQIIKEGKEKLNNSYLISFTINGIERNYLQNLSVSSLPLYDFASDKEVIDYCIIHSRLASSKNITLNEWEKIALQNKNNKNLKDRWLRFYNIVHNFSKFKDEYISHFKEFFQKEEGKLIINEYIKVNENSCLNILKQSKKKEIDDAVQQKIHELSLLNEKVSKSQQEIRKLEHQFDKSKEDIKFSNTEQIKLVNEQKDQAIKNKNQEIERLTLEVKRLELKYADLNSLEKLKKEISGMEYYKEKIQEDVRKLEDSITHNKQTLREGEQELRKKLMDIKPLVDTINGSFNNLEIKSLDLKVSCTEKRKGAIHKVIEDQQLIIDSIRKRFINQGRFVEEWEISNLLIITQQSFLTILAGLPGTGKTSLARLLASAQNLEKRICEIPVAKGWTSCKDLVGMFNPINSTFQPSGTGLFAFLKSLQVEELERNPMAYVLLDEANLSQIEHYWSSFIGMTDETKNRKLSLSPSDVISINNSLRFIATINYDETTESLSPRIIDRAPIIFMNTTLERHEEFNLIEECALPFSYTVMEELFGLSNEKLEFEDLEAEIIKKVLQLLKNNNASYGSSIPISMRKLNAIKQYHYKAKPLMCHKENLSIDLTILQYILPLINGQGDNFGRRLRELLSILEEYNLEKSGEYLKNIIATGEQQFNSYNFFCW